jgi:hypothetical protein
VVAFPEHRWELRHLAIDGCWLAALEVWVTTDNLRLLSQPR